MSTESDGSAARQGIDLANAAIKQMARDTSHIRPMKMHPTNPGCCTCGKPIGTHDDTDCESTSESLDRLMREGKCAGWVRQVFHGIAGPRPPLPNAATVTRLKPSYWRRLWNALRGRDV